MRQEHDGWLLVPFKEVIVWLQLSLFFVIK